MTRPESLKKGDKVSIVAPAGRLEPQSLDKALTIFSEWELDVQTGDHVWDGYHYFAAQDADRLTDLQHALWLPVLE